MMFAKGRSFGAWYTQFVDALEYLDPYELCDAELLCRAVSYLIVKHKLWKKLFDNLQQSREHPVEMPHDIPNHLLKKMFFVYSEQLNLKIEHEERHEDGQILAAVVTQRWQLDSPETLRYGRITSNRFSCCFDAEGNPASFAISTQETAVEGDFGEEVKRRCVFLNLVSPLNAVATHFSLEILPCDCYCTSDQDPAPLIPLFTSNTFTKAAPSLGWRLRVDEVQSDLVVRIQFVCCFKRLEIGGSDAAVTTVFCSVQSGDLPTAIQCRTAELASVCACRCRALSPTRWSSSRGSRCLSNWDYSPFCGMFRIRVFW